MDKSELAAFLRSRRERLHPEDVGLPSGARRRTPGLRREEIAVLAHISTEYYVRLDVADKPGELIRSGSQDEGVRRGRRDPRTADERRLKRLGEDRQVGQFGHVAL